LRAVSIVGGASRWEVKRAEEAEGLCSIVEGLTEVLPRQALQEVVSAGFVGRATSLARWGVYKPRFETVGVMSVIVPTFFGLMID
jgi:hypothetical protein